MYQERARVDSLQEELAKVREEGDELQRDLEPAISKRDSVRAEVDTT